MVKEVNHVCERLNKRLGISVSIPNPKSKTLKAASAYNFAAGVGLVAAGVVFSSKWCAVLGGLGIASSVVLRHESGGRKDEP